MERLDVQLFFYIITIAIDALLHALWHFSYTLIIELIHILLPYLICYFAQVALDLVFSTRRWSGSVTSTQETDENH